MTHAIFEKIRRIKEKNNTWNIYFSRTFCVVFLFLNLLLVLIWFGPEHIKHPVRQQIHAAMPQSVHDHVSARIGVNAHDKFYKRKDGTSGTGDDDPNSLSSIIAQQNEDRDGMMISSGVCGNSNNNNNNNNNSHLLLLEEEDTETRLAKYGFKNIPQTCVNFEVLRDRAELSSWWSRGSVVAPGLFRCQFLLPTNNNDILDNCWCSKKFSTMAANPLHSTRDLKRFVNTYSSLFMLNGSVTLHAEKIMGKIPIPPYCLESELERVRREFSNHPSSSSSPVTATSMNSSGNNTSLSSENQNGSSSLPTAAVLNSENKDTSPRNNNENNKPPPPFTVNIVTNATLRQVLQQVTKVQNRLRKSGIHINKNTKITRSDEKAGSNKKVLTTSEVFIHIVASQLHHNFEGKKCLVWSSRKMPTVEVAMYALSGAKHVDAVATQAYRTTVPSMTVFTPPEFVAKITSKENKRIAAAAAEQSSSSSSSTISIRQQQQQYQYGAIISFMTLQELGLGRFGEVIDPFADFHAMNDFWHLLQPGGTLLLVIPVSADCFDFNQRRVYGRARLAILLRGWSIDFSVGINEKTLNPLTNGACHESKVTESLIVLRRSAVNWNDRESVETDGIGRIPGLL